VGAREFMITFVLILMSLTVLIDAISLFRALKGYMFHVWVQTVLVMTNIVLFVTIVIWILSMI
jgi:hypothetical protein